MSRSNAITRAASAPRAPFARHLARNLLVALAMVLVSLVAGMVGYHAIERLSWVDAFLNSAMLLGGMGPVDAPKTDAGKIFAGVYAMYCGLFLLIAAGFVLAPALHRFLRRFHAEDETR